MIPGSSSVLPELNLTIGPWKLGFMPGQRPHCRMESFRQARESVVD